MPFGKTFLRLLPKKKIQIGKTSSELEGISEDYFSSADTVRVLAKCTNDCEYPVLQREILPTQVICPVCKKVTLAGLTHCDKCGALQKKE